MSEIVLDGLAPGAPKKTAAERAAESLRQAIVDGELPPGFTLRIPFLQTKTGIGATPLREGLSRLVTDGLVKATGNRGFRVAPISRQDLHDLTILRKLIEIEALKLSIQNGDDAWEAGIVASLYRLEKALKSKDDASLGEIIKIHKAFHTALLAGCDSPRLLDLHSNLHDQALRYRGILIRQGLLDREDYLTEHQMLAKLALERHEELAIEGLRRHLGRTYAFVYGATAASDSSD